MTFRIEPIRSSGTAVGGIASRCNTRFAEGVTEFRRKKRGKIDEALHSTIEVPDRFCEASGTTTRWGPSLWVRHTGRRLSGDDLMAWTPPAPFYTVLGR